MSTIQCPIILYKKIPLAELRIAYKRFKAKKFSFKSILRGKIGFYAD